MVASWDLPELNRGFHSEKNIAAFDYQRVNSMFIQIFAGYIIKTISWNQWFPKYLDKWWELYQQWRWVNTYGLIVGMNMYKNPVFWRYQRFDPQPNIWVQQGTWTTFSACYNWNSGGKPGQGS
jgi:hypothetical protein